MANPKLERLEEQFWMTWWPERQGLDWDGKPSSWKQVECLRKYLKDHRKVKEKKKKNPKPLNQGKNWGGRRVYSTEAENEEESTGAMRLTDLSKGSVKPSQRTEVHCKNTETLLLNKERLFILGMPCQNQFS